MSRDALAVAFEAGASEELTNILRDLAERPARTVPATPRRQCGGCRGRCALIRTALVELVHLLRVAADLAREEVAGVVLG